MFISDVNCLVKNLHIRINGSNNTIKLGKNITIKSDCEFAITGNRCRIQIGDDSTFTSHVKIEVNEDNQFIEIGNDCMFSNNIILRTNDSHPIYSLDSQKRINPAKSIRIGNHVWIAAGVSILKGVNIGDGSVIGLKSIVTKDIPENVIAAGTPAKVIKYGIEWKRD